MSNATTITDACPASTACDPATDSAPGETENTADPRRAPGGAPEAGELEVPLPTDERAEHAATSAPLIDADVNTGAKLVPVTEAIRYRKRAQAAEQQLADLRAKLGAVETDLSKTRETIAVLERRQKIDALLADSDAVDVEVARLLTEAAVEMMDQPDVAAAIADLRRSKPYLFRTRRTEAGAMPARTRGPSQTVITAAEQAASTGSRLDLLRYLRLRRNASHAVA